MHPRKLVATLIACTVSVAIGQTPPPVAPSLGPTPAPARLNPGEIKPSWETRPLAGSFDLDIPAPRGQITDRNGNPLAQTRVSYNLAVSFPAPLTFTDRQIYEFTARQLGAARSLLGRELSIETAAVVKHYRNRAAVPFEIERDLSAEDLAKLKDQLPAGLVLRPVYVRFYPNGPLAGHIIGYAGRSGKIQNGPLQNNEKLWPESEGRDGIELAFNDQLTGSPGQMHLTFDKDGRKTAERISYPPQPGYNVVTTIDQDLQFLAEHTLKKRCKRGAIVILDPNNGDILAMASWPVYNPNDFVPTISPETFQRYNDDPSIPLLPRAFRSAYPPGSTFKVFVGLAALQSKSIEPGSEFGCPVAFSVGNSVMRNWKKTDAGSMDFVRALTQSCNTWFYQVGIKTGSVTLVDYAFRLGLGKRTGIPLGSETEGRIPTDEYMLKVHKRKLLKGDVANFAIGQGDILISPLQMAAAMAAIGNGGTVVQPRLVQQVQTIDNKVVTAYGIRARRLIDISPEVMKALRKGMVDVVSNANGTAGQASIPGVDLAGKTGTAQWGPTKKQRTAAWFAGFVPAEKPQYAFAAVYEGEPNDNSVHGGTHAAPLIGKVFRQIYAERQKLAKEEKARKTKADKEAAAQKKKEAEEEEEISSPQTAADQSN